MVLYGQNATCITNAVQTLQSNIIQLQAPKVAQVYQPFTENVTYCNIRTATFARLSGLPTMSCKCIVISLTFFPAASVLRTAISTHDLERVAALQPTVHCFTKEIYCCAHGITVPDRTVKWFGRRRPRVGGLSGWYLCRCTELGL